MLSKLSDLSELSDVHSDHQVRFANQELSKLYKEIECVQVPSLNMDLNNTSHFLSAMEFSISKTHQTLPDVATDPAFKSLEQVCNFIFTIIVFFFKVNFNLFITRSKRCATLSKMTLIKKYLTTQKTPTAIVQRILMVDLM